YASSRYSRMCCEIARSQLALLLAGDRQEQNRSRRTLAHVVELGCDLDDRRRSRRVVHRAVVNAIHLGIDGLADAEMIDMRRYDDVLAAESGVSPAQNSRNVLRLDFSTLDSHGGLHARGKHKPGQRLSGIRQPEQLLERMARSRKYLVGMRGIDRRAELLAGRS